MKQTLIDMMNAMMPHMKIPLTLAVLLGVAGLVLLIAKWVLAIYKTPVGHSNFMGSVLAGRVGAYLGLSIVSWGLIAIGVFYLVCHAMGLFLGMTPKINFGDPKAFEFNLVPFWQLGLGTLAAGLIFRFFNRTRA